MVVRTTGDILMMTLSRILTVVVGTQTYTCDKSIELNTRTSTIKTGGI